MFGVSNTLIVPVTFCVGLSIAGPALGAENPPAAPEDFQPARTLLLALDGVPLRVVEEARAQGAFEGWSPTTGLVSTFPSTTHVAFTTLFEPFGVAPAQGYEMRYFDWEKNDIVGGSPFGYEERGFAYKSLFHVQRKSLRQKFVLYTSPGKTARRELKVIRNEVLVSPRELFLAHVGSTDALQHLRGDDASLRFLLELDEKLAELKRAHLEMHGRPLRVVLYSDHGNTQHKVHGMKGFRRLLRRAGFRVVEHLRGPDDVAAPTFGIVSYTALFLRPERAAEAAETVVTHQAVDLAAWLSGPRQIEVLSQEGRASIEWQENGGRRWFAYHVISGDPLHLAQAVKRLSALGHLDSAGFAEQHEWFRETALADYPDPLRRLADALAGERIESRATVLLSLKPGYGWGLPAAHFVSRIRGGRIEGTHGGLDRESSLGFWITDDPTGYAPAALRADRALAAFGPQFTASATPRAAHSSE